jgi:hypothetical protein
MTATTTRRALLLAFMGTVATAAIVGAPHAKADQYDFISTLDSEGVYYRDINGMINDGKMICGWLRGEQPIGQIMHNVVTEGGFDANDAARVVLAAAQDMCPDTMSYLQQQYQAAQGQAQDQRHMAE